MLAVEQRAWRLSAVCPGTAWQPSCAPWPTASRRSRCWPPPAEDWASLDDAEAARSYAPLQGMRQLTKLTLNTVENLEAILPGLLTLTQARRGVRCRVAAQPQRSRDVDWQRAAAR